MLQPARCPRIAAASLVAALAFAPAHLTAQTIRDGFNATQLDRGGSTSSDAIELPFLTNIRGSTDDQLAWGDPNTVFVCTDGFVVFGLLAAYCPADLQWAGQTPSTLITGAFTALAPLYRNLNLPLDASQGGSIGWGIGDVDGRAAWGATWLHVPTNTSNDAAYRHNFQVVLINRGDRGLGDFDVEFNYGMLGLGYNSATDVFAGAFDIGGFLDPDGEVYAPYIYTVAPTPNSRITMCWVGGSVNNAGCAAGGTGPDIPTVPEPSPWSLLAAGCGAFFFVARRRRA